MSVCVEPSPHPLSLTPEKRGGREGVIRPVLHITRTARLTFYNFEEKIVKLAIIFTVFE